MFRLTSLPRAYLPWLLAVAALALGACQPSRPEANFPEHIIRAQDYTFEAPAQIPAGRAWIQLQNEGAELHHIQFARLNDGVTFDQFQTELAQKGEAALALATFPGGVGILSPDSQGRVLLDLTVGQYALLCFMPDANGVPHLAKGMVVPIQVVSGAEIPEQEPQADVTAKVKDFTVELPAEVKAGAQLWKVTNDGPQPHEVMILKLAEGKTADDALAFLATPQGVPPFEWLGGMQALTTGQSGWLELNLTPGNYVAFCQVPDPASGVAHHRLGMLTSFRVR